MHIECRRHRHQNQARNIQHRIAITMLASHRGGRLGTEELSYNTIVRQIQPNVGSLVHGASLMKRAMARRLAELAKQDVDLVKALLGGLWQWLGLE